VCLSKDGHCVEAAAAAAVAATRSRSAVAATRSRSAVAATRSRSAARATRRRPRVALDDVKGSTLDWSLSLSSALRC